MTDPYYSDSWQRDIYLVEVGIPGPAGTGFTAAEATQVRTDLDELLARPEIDTLESLTNVPDSGAVNGQTVVKTTGGWAYGNPNSSLTSVSDSWSGEPAVTNATILTTAAGIKVTEETAAGGKRAHLALQFAGTGTATTAARSDHQHNPVIHQVTSIPYQGGHSSGIRTISPVGHAITGLLANETYDIDVTAIIDVITAGVNSNFAARIAIGTGSFVGYAIKFNGDGKVVTVKNVATGITGVTSLPVVVNVYWASGPAIEIGEGQIVAVAKPRR